MKLILHLGTHRTGTTSLQHHLKAHRQQLLAQRVYYPNTKPFLGGPSVAQFSLAHILATDPKHPGIPAFVSHIKDMARRGFTILLSSEPLYRHVEGGGTPANLSRKDYWTLRERYLLRLRMLLSDFEVRPVISFRRQDTFIESLYSQHVAREKEPILETFAEYRHTRRNMLLYARQMDVITKALGRPSVLLYEKSQDMVGDVVNSLGLALPPMSKRHFPSPDPRLILWTVKHNRNEGGGEWTDRQSFIVGDDATSLLPAAESLSLWSREERMEMLQALAEENKRLGEMIGIPSPFPADIPDREQAVLPEGLDEALSGSFKSRSVVNS